MKEISHRPFFAARYVLDQINVHQFGSLENATPFIKHQMKKAGLDINNPREVAVVTFIDNLAVIEGGYKSAETVKENRFKRLKLFGYKQS